MLPELRAARHKFKSRPEAARRAVARREEGTQIAFSEKFNPAGGKEIEKVSRSVLNVCGICGDVGKLPAENASADLWWFLRWLWRQRLSGSRLSNTALQTQSALIQRRPSEKEGTSQEPLAAAVSPLRVWKAD